MVVKTRIGFCPIYNNNKQPRLPALLDLLVVVVFFLQVYFGFFLFCMFYGGGLPSRLQLGAEGTWEMEKDKIFVQRMHLFPSKTSSVSCLGIIFLKKFSLTKLVCLAKFIYVQSFSLGVCFLYFP